MYLPVPGASEVGLALPFYMSLHASDWIAEFYFGKTFPPRHKCRPFVNQLSPVVNGLTINEWTKLMS